MTRKATRMKINELTGTALDWAVAKITHPEWWDEGYMTGDPIAALDMDDGSVYSPSTDWSRGGPIIERETIGLEWGPRLREQEWLAWTPAPEQTTGEAHAYGPTPLIAAMRCYVASRLGDEVQVPEGLK